MRASLERDPHGRCVCRTDDKLQIDRRRDVDSLLDGMASEIVRRHVACDHDQGNRIERGVRDAGRRVRETRTQVSEEHAGLAGRARVSIGSVRGDLLVACRDEAHFAVPQRRQHRNNRVTSQAKDDLNPEAFEYSTS